MIMAFLNCTFFFFEEHMKHKQKFPRQMFKAHLYLHERAKAHMVCLTAEFTLICVYPFCFVHLLLEIN